MKLLGTTGFCLRFIGNLCFIGQKQCVGELVGQDAISV